MVTTTEVQACLQRELRELRLPMFRENFAEVAHWAAAESLGCEDFLLELCRRECAERRNRRIERYLKDSGLPLEKDLASYRLQRLPALVRRQVSSLLDGGFADRRENVLVFGTSGAGKTHLLCGAAQELIRQQGRRVCFRTCSLLVQELLLGKRDLALKKVLKRLSQFDVLIIDDIGYVQQSREEMEVLFTLLAERYERGSVMLTSNLPFSKWESIFKDPMTTAAAIDRLVHHSVILELNVPSYRLESAKRQQTETATPPDNEAAAEGDAVEPAGEASA
jgi:DNA replication protein DnaC